MPKIIINILGWLATILFCIMPIPQIIKTLKCKTVSDISIIMYLIYFIANIIAIIYAIQINQPPLIFKYFLSAIIAIFYISIYFLIKRKKI